MPRMRPFVRDVGGGSFGHADSEVLLSLNCNRGAATATTPGASMGSPEGRAFQAKAEEQAAAAKSGARLARCGRRDAG